MEIYVLIDNEPQGPYTPELVQLYLQSGQLKPSYLAAYAGSADWQPLSAMVASWGKQPTGKGSRFTGTRPAVAAAKKRKMPVFPFIAAAIVLLLAGGGFTWWKLFGNSGPQFKVETPAESGIPNTPADLNAWYKEPPQGQNAATWFLKGIDAMQITDADRNSTDLPVLGKGEMPALGSKLPPRTKTAIVGLTQRNRDVWPSFAQGMKFDQARYPIDLNQGAETLLPHINKIKQSTLLGGLTASLLADNGRAQPAGEILLSSMACGQSLRYEPLPISQLVRSSCLGILATNLERVVNSVTLPPAELERLATALAKAEQEESSGEGFTRGVAGERAMNLAVFDLPPDKLEEMLGKMLSASNSGSSAAQGGLRQRILIKKITRNLKSQRAFTEETFNRAISMRQQPFPERLKTDEYFATRAEEAKTNDLQLCQLVLPALGKLSAREATGLTELRLAQAAVALERFRAANDSYPTALSELAPKFLPDVPQDPFSGNPLHYVKQVNGYELSSAGMNPIGPKEPLAFKVVNAPKGIHEESQ